ncbi:MAG: hypothetical protein K0R50_1470 [Eubacterium sp.]|nr:hypothetical protein [Eubacterium sp.]
MKKFISIFLAIMLVMSSSMVFAKNGNGNGSNGNGDFGTGKDKKYYDKTEDYQKSLEVLKELLRNYNEEIYADEDYYEYDEEYVEDLINQILTLKNKNKDESTSIFINGKEYLINDGNVIKYKNFQLPTKPITEGLGAAVNWNGKTHIITITKDNIKLVMNLDSRKVTVNGFEIKNSVLTTSKKNKTIVLIKFIAEVLGKKAEINEGAGAVIIEDDGSTSINDNITGKGLNQFQYSSKWNYGSRSGAYLEDNHWSSSRNAYYKVKFNGNQIKLFGATSYNHGIAAVSIDNGPEIYVDFYSAARTDNVQVYTSPVLSQGQHTLKVRVTGTKNRYSKGYNIPADRVNVLSNSIPQTGSNLALNKNSFSDSQQAQNTASRGNDGNLSTRWCAADGSTNHWWTVDLGALYNIRGTEVTWEKSGKVYKYKIEVSADNYNWSLKINKSNNTINQQVQADGFYADAGRYVRISVTGLDADCWASFSEFKVFGAGTNTDTQAPTAPTGLVISAPTSNEVALNWNASGDNIGTVGYKVFRNGTQINTVTSGTSYRDKGLTAGTAYVYSVVAYDAAGNSSDHSSFVYVTTPTSNGRGNGLKGEYYNNRDLTDIKFTRIDNAINASWYNSSPDSRIDNETFSIRWTGQIQPLYSESYTFYTTSDDGVRLWINGTKLIDNWNDHSAAVNSGTISLTSGQKYDIVLEYYNNQGEGKIKLEWSSNSQSKQIVQKSQLYYTNSDGYNDTQAPTTPVGLTAKAVSANQIKLSWSAASDNTGVAGYRVIRDGRLIGTVYGTAYTDTGLAANTTYSYQVLAYDAAGNSSNHSSYAYGTTPSAAYGNGNGLKGEYFDNMNFTNLIKERADDNINFNWGPNAPLSSMGADEFSIRWTGQIQPLYSETYTFHTVSDDGLRLWVNGNKIIDNWADHSLTENSGTIALNAGQKYDIKYEYYEKNADAVAKLFWSSPSQSKQIIPKSQLYSAELDSQAPAIPTWLTGTAITVNQINLNWTPSVDNTGVAGYKIYRNGNLVGTVTSTNYSDKGLAANTTYSYSVSAFDAAGNTSAQCQPVTVSTKLAADNLAMGKAVSADSEENGNPARNGNDGKLSTRWCAADGEQNHWWKVDLGNAYNLTGTEVIWEKNKAYKYKIEVSQDDTNWTVAVDKTGNTTAAQTQADSFSANSVRYVKITLTGLDTGCWASFSEFKVF